MTFLPIVERELRVAARHPATYRTRIWFVVITSVIAAGLLLIGGQSGSGSMGGDFFRFFGVLAFFYCLLAGLRYTADALSEEKREGTLGLLFLTDLRGYDVALGKLMSAGTRTLQGLLAFFPVLAVGLLLGGITVGELWRATAILLNALFFAMCVGLWVSSMTRQAHVALAGSIAVLILVTFAAPMLEDILSRIWPGYVKLLSLPSPAAAGLYAADLAYRADPARFWRALVMSHLAGWCLLAMTSVIVPKSWQERPVGPPLRRATAQARAIRATARSERRAGLRRRLLEVNPICWLASRHERQRELLWLFMVTWVIGGAIALVISYLFAGSSLGMCSLLGFTLGTALKIWIAWYACATLSEAGRTGAVELLLATPLTVPDIIRGHWQALQRIFLWPVLGVLAFSVLPALEALFRQPGTWMDWLPLPGLTLFGMGTYLLDVVALAWAGMWMGLSQPRTIQAFAKTILFVMILPAVVFCLPNIVFDLFWIAWARQRLERQFRLAAAGRYAPPQPTANAWLPQPISPMASPPVITPGLR